MIETPYILAAVNLIAILVGPVLAVWVGQRLERQRQDYNRRMAIFRDLMRYRRTILSPEYVGALNLVEVEFNKYPEVLIRWRTLYEHLHSPTDDKASFDVLRAWNEKADRLHALLIHSIAKAANLPLEQLDIVAGYAPKAWNENEDRQRLIQISLLQVLSGNKAIRVNSAEPLQPYNPYPAAPEED
tara:strand:- start:1612 stop:2169 length:558 start_codon:yes stop_codon:yes gene_type:complete